MPLCVAPGIRALQEVMEEQGVIQKMDSVAVTAAKTNESLGLAVKTVVYKTWYVQNAAVKQR